MDVGTVGRAAGMFAVTNVDDILILVLFYARALDRGGRLRIAAGQYLGFGVILALSVLGALGASVLPDSTQAYLGLVPLLLGVGAGWQVWRERGEAEESTDAAPLSGHGPGVLAVAGVTLANGGDNIGVYVPAFTTAGAGGLITYSVVFLVLVAVWCGAGWFLVTRPVIARALSRWGDLLLPVVLVGIGLIILIDGHAFGL